MKPLNVLVGFEESQEVTAAFIALGHNAMSCDKYFDGAKGLPHYKGDIFDVLTKSGILSFFTHRVPTRHCVETVGIITAH